jgi:hypothetical protein
MSCPHTVPPAEHSPLTAYCHQFPDVTDSPLLMLGPGLAARATDGTGWFWYAVSAGVLPHYPDRAT